MIPGFKSKIDGKTATSVFDVMAAASNVMLDVWEDIGKVTDTVVSFDPKFTLDPLGDSGISVPVDTDASVIVVEFSDVRSVGKTDTSVKGVAISMLEDPGGLEVFTFPTTTGYGKPV